MSEPRSVDALLATANQAPPVEAPEPQQSEPVAQEVQHAEPEAESKEVEAKAEEPSSTESDTRAEETPIAETDLDEYGNATEKPKTYSEEDVQRMIRDRFSRGQFKENQPIQQQAQQAPQESAPDNAGDDDWQTQLEGFIDKTIEKKKTQAQEREWRQQQEQTQAEFETKFSSGMTKYKDFENVVSGKPITNSMMMATRSMKDPAAFIYAASKMQPAELDRIARLPDAYQQATEMGRLHERMVKARDQVSKASKPTTTPKGDMPAKGSEHRSVDDRIRMDAKRKLVRR